MDGNSDFQLTASGRSWDAVVIGAGPAGALTAHQLASRGMKTLLVERKAFPRDKVCGGCLNVRAVALLDKAGLGGLLASSRVGRTESLHLYTHACELSVPVPDGRVICRSYFDAELVKEAVGQGASFLQQTHATIEPLLTGGRRSVLLKRTDGHSETVHAKVVLVCDGLNGGSLSRLPWMRAAPSADSRLGLGTVLEGAAGFEPGRIHMAVDARGYVGLVRLPDGRVNLAAAIEPSMLKRRRPAEAMGSILEECRLPVPSDLETVNVGGTTLLTRSVSRLACDRLLLVGDAGGYLEPITGEGMAWAIASALAATPLVAEALVAWKPQLADQWEQTVGQLVASRQSICRSLTRLTRHPRLLSFGMRSLAIAPWVLAPIVNHLNRVPPTLEAL